MRAKKVLWICNLTFPRVAEQLGFSVIYAGGWLIGASNELKNNQQYELYIVSLESKIKKIIYFEQDNITFCVIPKSNVIDSYLELKEKIDPHIIHVFGTELPHSWDVLKVFDRNQVVFSIQGLTSEYDLHYTSNLPINIIYRRGIYELLTMDTIINQNKNYHTRGCKEIQLIRNAKYVIGRTEWDRAVVKKINSQIKYYKCNETLRDEFYHSQWNLHKINRHTIFMSQGSSPIKGLHYVIEALNLIKSSYSDVHLYVAGTNIFKNVEKGKKWKLSSYVKYLYELVNKYNLKDNISFLGNLDSEDMKCQYLKTNVYVCASSIENSPNSLGEAMILGVPCVASYVGGIPSMLEHNKEGFLYQHDSVAMLAYYVKRIFEDNHLALQLSLNARQKALETHNAIKNNKELLNIYHDIMGRMEMIHEN